MSSEFYESFRKRDEEELQIVLSFDKDYKKLITGMIFRFENAHENNDVTLGATSLGFRRAPGEDEIPYNLVRIP